VLAVLLAIAPARAATPPPTPVPPRGSPSPFVTELDVRPPNAKPPEIDAKAAVLVDPRTGQIVYGKRVDARRAVASLTKLMTALVVVEGTKPGEWVTVSEGAAPPKNLVGISTLGLKAGERIRVQDLLYALLLQSANDAAVALAVHVSGTSDAFEREMNALAAELGAEDSMFLSPNGLDDAGYSTASDIARIASAVLDTQKLRKIMQTKFYEIAAPQGPPREIQNRNVMLWLYPGTTGGKTGFTSDAGYCVVVSARRGDMSLLTVILGEKGEPFSEAASLLDWGFASLEEATPVQQGDPVGTRRIGDSEVAMAAGETLTVLMPSRDVARVNVTARVEGPDWPVAVGDVIGVVKVAGPSGPLGEVPLVASAVSSVQSPSAAATPTPQSGEDEDAPWWLRLLRAIWDAITGFFERIFGD